MSEILDDKGEYTQSFLKICKRKSVRLLGYLVRQRVREGDLFVVLQFPLPVSAVKTTFELIWIIKQVPSVKPTGAVCDAVIQPIQMVGGSYEKNSIVVIESVQLANF